MNNVYLPLDKEQEFLATNEFGWKVTVITEGNSVPTTYNNVHEIHVLHRYSPLAMTAIESNIHRTGVDLIHRKITSIKIEGEATKSAESGFYDDPIF